MKMMPKSKGVAVRSDFRGIAGPNTTAQDTNISGAAFKSNIRPRHKTITTGAARRDAQRKMR